MKKEFNLSEWEKSPEKFILTTRVGGKRVRILATDIKDPIYPICAAVGFHECIEEIKTYTEHGHLLSVCESEDDIMMIDEQEYEYPEENADDRGTRNGRQHPVWIRGDKDNPDGVILAMMTEFPDCEWMTMDLFNENSGLRDNAGNPECIFYYSERLSGNDRVRLLDECDTLEKEWITTSSAWREIKPSDAASMKELKKINDKFKNFFPKGFFGKYSGKEYKKPEEIKCGGNCKCEHKNF